MSAPGPLVAGHVAVLAGTFALAPVLVFDGIVRTGLDPTASGPTAVTGLVLLSAGCAALVAGEVLAVRRLLRRARSIPPTADALLAGAALIGWTTGLALMPVLLGLFHLVVAAPPPPLLAAVGALVLAAVLLDHADADRTHRDLPPGRPDPQPLPRALADRIRAGQSATTVIHALLGLTGIGLLVLTATTELRRADPAPGASAVQVVSALACVALVVLLTVPVWRIRGAVVATPQGAAVDGAALGRAARGLSVLRRVALVVAVLATAALLLDPAAPRVAAARVLVLVLLLASTTLQHASLAPIALGTPVPDLRRALPSRRGNR